MDTQQTPINRDERRRGRRSRAVERVSSWWDEWVVIRGGDRVGAIAGLLGSGFEGISWTLRRYLLWPAQDRAAGLGAGGRVLAAVAAALIVGVGVAALLSAGSGREGEPSAAPVAVAAPQEPPAAKPEPVAAPQPQPTLSGAEPEFKPARTQRQDKPELDAAEQVAAAPAGADPATTRIGSEPGAATSSLANAPADPQSAVGIDGPPAGPKAIAVAEDFAGAFVLYETGGEKSKVRKAFKATATPELTKSLLQRPPRQPANVEVPQARVVNVVAGPSRGGVYSVSVSLLRVGLTSELRLDMEKLKDEWRVTNVLG